jgi:two-component system nitrate/nitrite response regulator NarL
MTGEGAIRVVIADDHPIFRIGLRTLIGSEPHMELVGEAENGDQAIELARTLRPDILLLELHLPGTNGLEVLKRLGSLNVETRTVLLTASIERGQMRTALVRGAWGVLFKHTATDLLTKCIRQVSRGEYWVGRDTVGELVDALRNPVRTGAHSGSLTPRENEIVALIVTGASNKDIAWRLGLNEQTVKNHLRKIFDKLQVANRVELALAAVERRLVSLAEVPAGGPVPRNEEPMAATDRFRRRHLGPGRNRPIVGT